MEIDSQKNLQRKQCTYQISVALCLFYFLVCCSFPQKFYLSRLFSPNYATLEMEGIWLRYLFIFNCLTFLVNEGRRRPENGRELGTISPIVYFLFFGLNCIVWCRMSSTRFRRRRTGASNTVTFTSLDSTWWERYSIHLSLSGNLIYLVFVFPVHFI